MARLFVAIDLPAPIQERLAHLCSGLPGARWIPPEQMHLTLRFIGEVSSETAGQVREVLHEVRSGPFHLQLEGVGFFPPRGNPRVVWAGIRPSGPLVVLRNRVESVLRAAGLEPEGRKFAPHITLARLRSTPAKRVASYLAHNGLFLSEEFPVKGFTLYSSVLSHRGAKHFVEQVYGFFS